MPEFSSSKIIFHRFHINNDKGEFGIGYDMIIDCDLMAQLGLMANFKRKVLQWYGAAVPMKETNSLLGQIYLTSSEMCDVAMKTAEPVSTREATKIRVRILNSN